MIGADCAARAKSTNVRICGLHLLAHQGRMLAGNFGSIQSTSSSRSSISALLTSFKEEL